MITRFVPISRAWTHRLADVDSTACGCDSTKRVAVLFGTRPELIKLAPVIKALHRSKRIEVLIIHSGQHRELVDPLLALFSIRPHYDLAVMQPGQSLQALHARVMLGVGQVLAREQPDLLLVQGDTTTALAGAMAGFHSRVPVGHIEAGLRSGSLKHPFPEEMNRRLITQLATWHFAATPRNRRSLLAEGVRPERIFVTGNPVVDSLQSILRQHHVSAQLDQLLDRTRGFKRIVWTSHRRESHGKPLRSNLRVLRRFVAEHGDVAAVVPLHPNPAVRQVAEAELTDQPRIILTPALSYPDFLGLMAHAWLIVSDSGGVQEEAPSLGKPLLILRNTTERPEAVECGIATVVGLDSDRLHRALKEAYQRRSGERPAGIEANPFGSGNSGRQIARIVCRILARTSKKEVRT